MKWHTILTIAQKDILDGIRNFSLLFALLLPIVLSLLVQVAFPDSDDVGALTIAIYDPGLSQLTTALENMTEVELVKVSSEQELQERVKNISGGLSVPAGFDVGVKHGEEPELTVYLNRKRGGGELAGVREVVRQQVWALANPKAPARLKWVDLNVVRGLFEGGEFRFDRYLLVMILVMSLAMTGSVVVPTLLVEEKEKHTLDALLLSPAGPMEVTLAKALVGLLYSFLISGILLLLHRGWEGDWPLTLLAIFLGALFLVGSGLLMGSLFRTIHQVNSFSGVVALVLMVPTWTGILGPETAFSRIMALIPTYYLSDAVGLALAGEGFTSKAWMDLGILAGAALLVFCAVVWTLRREKR